MTLGLNPRASGALAPKFTIKEMDGKRTIHLILESVNTFEAPTFKSTSKTNSKPSAAGSIWKGGAAE